MKIETSLIYRLYLFGLLLVLLNFCNFSLSSLLYESSDSLFNLSRNWKLLLFIQILLSILVFVLISKTKNLSIYSEKLNIRTIKNLILIVLFFILFRQIFTYNFILVVLPLLFWIILKVQEKYLNFLIKINDENSTSFVYDFSLNKIFVIFTKTLLFLSVTYQVLNIVFDVSIPRIYSMDIEISLKSKLISLVLVYSALIFFIFINSKSFSRTLQGNKESSIKLWFSILIFYLCVVYLPDEIGYLLDGFGEYKDVILLPALFILSTIVNRITFVKNYKNINNINYESINSSILVFSIFYLMFILWEFYFYGDIIYASVFYFVIQPIIILLILIFKKKIFSL